MYVIFTFDIKLIGDKITIYLNMTDHRIKKKLGVPDFV